MATWNNAQIAPIAVARDLWQTTLLQPNPSIGMVSNLEMAITPKP
jgi:hypothetical protein